jgi:hypothetical protein
VVAVSAFVFFALDAIVRRDNGGATSVDVVPPAQAAPAQTLANTNGGALPQTMDQALNQAQLNAAEPTRTDQPSPPKRNDRAAPTKPKKPKHDFGF